MMSLCHNTDDTAQQDHVPVLLDEVITALDIKDNGVYIDGTFGRGGYSRAILDAANCSVYGIDRDPDAVKSGEVLAQEYPNRFTMIHGCFGDMQNLLKEKNIDQVDGITLDLGVSSAQLDQAERGFSFKKNGPLDMRMSGTGETAADLVNNTDEEDLADIIYEYGEEHKSRYIARAIVEERMRDPITTTSRLADIVREVVRKKGKTDPATKTFQAIRIAVNAELDELRKALNASLALLKNNGRLAIVSFHSLEDKEVKSFLRHMSGESQKPVSRHIPHDTQNKVEIAFSLLKKSAIKPSEAEMVTNPRSRSARLRVATRIKEAI